MLHPALSARLSPLIRNSVLEMLTGLMSILHRLGIQFRDVNDLCKRAYVRALQRDARIEGREPSISAIAMRMGVKRDVVSEILATQSDEISVVSVPALVAALWNDKVHDGDGRPRRLTRKEFAKLCRRITGKYPPSTIAKELIAAGNVREIDRRWYELRSHKFTPINDLDETIAGQFKRVGGHLRNIAHNIGSLIDDDPAPFWFDRVVVHSHIADADLAELRKQLQPAIHDALDRLGKRMDEMGRKPGDVELNSVLIGIYYGEVTISEKWGP